MMARAFGIAVLTLLLAGGAAFAQDVLKPGDEISGKLRFFHHQHSNGTWINVYQITSDHPRMFAGNDDFCDDTKPPVTFHLIVMDDKATLARLKKLLGKTVTVVAEQFFCSETAWHIGDAVLGKWHFAEPAKR